MHELFLKTHAAGGASVKAGAELVSYALKAGARRDQITASFGTWTFATPEERKMWGKFSVTFQVSGEAS